MPLVRLTPTSPGRRGAVKVKSSELWKGKPLSSLTEKKRKNSGRNNHGHITTRHQGGAQKKLYRKIDFRRKKDDVPAVVERIEYDPNRSARILLLCYLDGDRSYILAPKGVKVGDKLVSGEKSHIKDGNSLPLKSIPVGTTLHCVELRPGKGAQIARSAGSSVQLLAREGGYAQLRMKSGEIRKVLVSCRATIGEVGNSEHNLRQLGKAGASRWRGIRPTVRGVVMNPFDHPHGGGEGRTGTKRDPVSPWGTLTKGFRTRKNKKTQYLIIRRRQSKKQR